MRIESVDFFYLTMPVIEDRGDGSQDALLVRVRGGGFEGWGECEAAPLVSIASWCCPPSHSACRPLAESVLGRRIDDPCDIDRLGRDVRRRSFDLLQAPHTLSGIDIALWDWLGRRLEEPVWRLLGFERSRPKTPYASALFADTAEATLRKARSIRASGYRAAKFGWGPYGSRGIEADADQVKAAREGIGDDALLFVDAGTIWGEDVPAAAARLPALEAHRVTWLEEPFAAGALGAYAELAGRSSSVGLAGGEGAHDEYLARQTIDTGRVRYIQVDAGRIGGISVAHRVARYADRRGVQFVNHTFTTELALSASIQPYAGLARHSLCEVPVEPSALARDLAPPLARGSDGRLECPDRPGLGVDPSRDAIRRYLVDADIRVGGRSIYRTPELD